MCVCVSPAAAEYLGIALCPWVVMNTLSSFFVLIHVGYLDLSPAEQGIFRLSRRVVVLVLVKVSVICIKFAFMQN